MARVGYIPSESRSYCLLLQLTNAKDAAYVKRQLQRTKLLHGLRPHVEFLRSHARRVTSCRADRSSLCEKTSDGAPSGEETSSTLEAICFASHAQCEASGSRGRSRRVAPTEGFCSICQDDIAMGLPYIVTLCQHNFHLACLRQHLDPPCPLCRFSMASLESKCQSCGTYEDLWTCLVCGWVGCGPGQMGDRQRHFESTGHSCAMQNSTSRIWNHTAKMFLHHELAMELGREDDVRAAQAAAADAPQKRDLAAEGVTASSYWRSRWWWDEKDEEAARDLNAEQVRKYYLKVMERLMEEQREHYERRREMSKKVHHAHPLSAAQQQLLAEETKGRRRVVADYMTGARRLTLHENLAFKKFVHQQVARNEKLSEELLLLSHSIQNLHSRIPTIRANVERANDRGAKQVSIREGELRALQEELEKVMSNLEK